MKKFLLVPLFAASTAWAAATGGVADLNAEIQKILAPFQNEATVAQVNFAKAETSAERALSLAVSALYKKVGAQNTLDINVKEIAYEYGDGSSPTTVLDASIGIDLTKLLPQEQLNELIPNVEQMIAEISKDMLKQYGEAITIETKVTDKTQDEAGNYTGVKGSINFSFDFSKLPEGTAKEDIVVQSGSANLSVNVKTGLAIQANIVSNTSYKGFHDDNEGLKEMLDKLLNKDQETMNQLLELFQKLEGFANQVVNGQQ